MWAKSIPEDKRMDNSFVRSPIQCLRSGKACVILIARFFFFYFLLTDLYLALIFVGFSYYLLYVDLDECTVGTHDCGENSNCINDIGSYYCDCKAGFFGDGEICEGERFRSTLNSIELIFVYQSVASVICN